MVPHPVGPHSPRRALATRDRSWARALARRLGRLGARPNGVSMLGIGYAVGAGVAFALAPMLSSPAARAAALIVAAVCIQLRLLCNLLDGMLAVEEGFGGKTGEIYNDAPDRAADVVILVGAGYAAADLPLGVTLGWTAAALALFTAYVRVLGGSLGVTQYFIGPMAKQHRMFALTLVTLIASAEAMLGSPLHAMQWGLVVIVVGSCVTAARRLRRIADDLQAR